MQLSFYDYLDNQYNTTLVNSDTGPSVWDREFEGGDVTDMGLGFYQVEYRLDSIGMFGISLTMDGENFLRKLTERNEDTIKTLGYDFFQNI